MCQTILVASSNLQHNEVKHLTEVHMLQNNVIDVAIDHRHKRLHALCMHDWGGQFEHSLWYSYVFYVVW